MSTQNTIKTQITFIGVQQETDWPHFLWSVMINGQHFDYKTGLGHRTDFSKKFGEGFNRRPDQPSVACQDIKAWVHKPTIDEVLHALFIDSREGQESFANFCVNLGYSDDSISAFNIYQACEENGRKLRKALGAQYGAEESRIAALNI